MAILFYVICTAWCQWDFLVFLSMNDFSTMMFLFYFYFLFAFVVIKCFMVGVNVWWVYFAPQNIPRAISVLTLGNKVVCANHQRSGDHTMFVLNARLYASTCKYYCRLAEKLLCHKHFINYLRLMYVAMLLNISEWQHGRQHAHNLILLHASRSYWETVV